MSKNEEIEQVREAAEADLLFFIRLVAPKRVFGSIHEEVMRWWTREDAKSNQLLLLPRGHQKSQLLAYRVAWWITRNPETTILYVSATAALAEKQLLAIKNILDSKIYRRYWPEMLNPDEGKREKWAISEISVDHPRRKQEGVRDSTVMAAGLTTNTTGFHADVVCLDDVVVPANAYTEDGRDKVASAYSQFASIENPGAQEWVVGTRYHPKDLYQTLIEMTEVLFNDDGEAEEDVNVYEVFQREVETDGEFLWPRQMREDGKYFGFDLRTLSRIKSKYVDTTQYFAQYYNNPNDAANAPVDRSKFQYYEKSHLKCENGDWFISGRKLNVYAAIDFAFSRSKKADSTAIVVIGIDSESSIYVLDIDRFKTDRILEYFNHLLELHSKWGFRKMRAEVTVAQQAIVRELKEAYIKPRGLYISIDEHRPQKQDGNKEERMAAILEPKYDNLQVWHYKGGNSQILEEELVMRRPPHDDVKDALANAIEIAVPPRRYQHQSAGSNVVYNSRFGGVAFRG